MKPTQSNPVIVKPYSLSELASMYDVSKRTFRQWLKPIAESIGQRRGIYYTVRQVKLIFDQIGMPPEPVEESA